MNYTKAAEIASQPDVVRRYRPHELGSRILSSRGSVISEARTNQLFVTDIASKLEQVQQ
jgi:type IV pilus assembly protein PilQ